MIYKVYSVLDEKTTAFTQPFHARTRGEAIRMFQQAINNGAKDNMFHKHSSDYTLFELGEWDDNQGTYTMAETKVNLGLATQYKNQEDIQLERSWSRPEPKGVELTQ